MNQEIKKKWVEALLSGKYKQGFGALCWQGKYCCLGVLREVAGGSVGNSQALGFDTLEAAEITDGQQAEFSVLNDADRVPFDMIAGLIDEAL